ncbi:exodeoxyribonuclease VII large subunit [Methylophaga nitratireducenticrescens]|uniref:Exodeoxyribonuclease 7 large subunit n=1 Tax=Methylophaga nitratireducenticrescens TaxID=754476 RepID=I1XGV7_METNJ|nr:exodeoxyribonuclease VII large subunit [Methylophaga nitratireducenticrescens]AFI83626.1 exodeoxyribonuclease VII large subunit [Methylophaga nitratireducenticrescens]AUZ83728.1 exodeoxyribonuclease VII large subunit [Methylophaga nitratireducenticrescens]
MASLMTSDSQVKLAARAVKDVYPVSRLVREVRLMLDGSFPLLWVEGEISNLAMPASGHIYFTLKDSAAQVRCAMFRGRNQQLRFTPENGMQVLLRVKVTLYEGRGEFQLVVEHMEEAGSGALQRAYEALKARLGQEGLFDTAHKKPLPALPQTIGIVSSPDGAAVHDILHVLKRRFPAIKVILYPVAVQGETAPRQIANAIQTADQRQECDLLIVGRGGGSLEDLWSFNDELVARALFACQIPTISAVGHEIDYTIADFVADVRAPTPSAAAELAVPEARQLALNLRGLLQNLGSRIQQKLANEQRHIRYLSQRLPRPQQQLKLQQQQLKRLQTQLDYSIQRQLQGKQQQLDYLSVRLPHPQLRISWRQTRLQDLTQRFEKAFSVQQQQFRLQSQNLNDRLKRLLPASRLKQQQQLVEALSSQLNRLVRQQITDHKKQLAQLRRTLSVVSPLNTLERGYSITSDAQTGNVIYRSDEVTIGQSLQIRLFEGQLDCEVRRKK